MTTANPGCCQEASVRSNETYIPCNTPATRIVEFPSGEGPYRMCEGCAMHTIGNRNGIDLGKYAPRSAPGQTPFQAILRIQMDLTDIRERADGLATRLERAGPGAIVMASQQVGYVRNEIDEALECLKDARDYEKAAREGGV